MSELKYIAYYSDPDESKHRKAAPSADTKIDYIVSVLMREGCNVKVISKCGVEKCESILKYDEDYAIEKNGTMVHFVPSLTSKFRSLRFFTRIFTKRRINRLIKKECLGTDCKILIYHSLGMYSVIKYLKKHKKPFILEVEEIYSDVMAKKKKQNREKEDFMFSVASSYIFSTELLNREINSGNKPYVVCNGTYNTTQKLVEEKIFDDKDKIHCVYAGTFDPRKGGAAAAVAAAKFLPSDYHIHILGFGNDAETKAMKDLTSEISKNQLRLLHMTACFPARRIFVLFRVAILGSARRIRMRRSMQHHSPQRFCHICQTVCVWSAFEFRQLRVRQSENICIIMTSKHRKR